jgi:nucleoside-diphosphate-sugar epimerase
MNAYTALVAGATGVTGGNLIEHLEGRGDWNVVGISRRPPDDMSASRFIGVDLLDRHDTEAKLEGLREVTHLFFAALQPAPNAAEEVAPNLAMLRNVVETIDAASPTLQRVVLLQGPKAYGVHLGPYKTPAKEDDPRHMPPNFYYDQQDWLQQRSRERGWTWTALRPSLICGFALGNPMNMLMAIAVYAAISKHLCLPLRFPGKARALSTLAEATDAALLARALEWAATEPRCAGEVFNITNGDCFRWQQLWPKVAAAFDMPVGTPLPMRLADFMADKKPAWQALVKQHGLRPVAYERIASWPFADAVFSIDYDIVSDTQKARRHGFNDCVDTERMFAQRFAAMRSQRIIP